VTALAPATGLDRLGRLRREFDTSFAETPQAHTEAPVDLLAVRVAGIGYAVALSAAVGLHADSPVTALPGPVAALRGVASFRGTIVAVYDLGALLGHPPSTSPRWLLLDTGTPPLGLAFDGVDGHLRVPAAAIACGGEDSAGGAVHEVVTVTGGYRPVIDVAAVRALVESTTRSAGYGRKR
jgi:purine-binding chemotaxis protein CheW